MVAVGRSLLIIIWHLLADPGARYTDLGPDYYARRTDPERRRHAHVQQLEALGFRVTLTKIA
jgi:transposase